MQALGQIGDARAVKPLIAKLENKSSTVRRAVLGGLLPTCKDETDGRLLTQDLDSTESFLDPNAEISEEWVRHAAEKLGTSVEEVRQRYEVLAQRFRLKLAWQPRAERSAQSPESEDINK